MFSRIQSSETHAQIGRETGINEAIIRGFLRDEANLRKFIDETDINEGPTRKRAKTSQKPEVDMALYIWFVNSRAEGFPISGPILQAQLANSNPTASTHATPFAASNGWLNRWQRRHGISAIKVSGEIRSADKEAVQAFVSVYQ